MTSIFKLSSKVVLNFNGPSVNGLIKIFLDSLYIAIEPLLLHIAT